MTTGYDDGRDGTTAGSRHEASSAMAETVGYGTRVALHLRTRLGYCAAKKLAGILDTSIRQAERLLRVSKNNRGPTVEQLFVLFHDETVGGNALIEAAFVNGRIPIPGLSPIDRDDARYQRRGVRQLGLRWARRLATALRTAFA